MNVPHVVEWKAARAQTTRTLPPPAVGRVRSHLDEHKLFRRFRSFFIILIHLRKKVYYKISIGNLLDRELGAKVERSS